MALVAALRIAAIHAHPDDMEILAAGTLALLSERGHHITVVTMTAGDCGTRDYPADEIRRIRRNEAAAAAAMIGAEYVWAGFDDLAIFNDDASRRKVVELLRRLRPNVVITAAPADYHCDHEATSVLVRDACFAAPAPNYSSGSAARLEAIPHLYFMNPDEGADREGRAVLPDFTVDVARFMEKKRDMLAAHESQRKWLQQHHGMDDYIQTMDEWTRACGRAAGIEYGEGFRHYKGHPYPRTPVLEEAIGAVIRKQA